MSILIKSDKPLVVVGMSSGVDSSAAAALLLEAGYEVHGLTLRTWRVSTADDAPVIDQAGAVAAVLGIPLHVTDARERFYHDVVVPFADAYARGLTPNPCVMCNPTLKFAALLDAADCLGAAWIATGHYARIERAPDGPTHLLRACNPHKDQSYALYRLTQTHLSRLLLPLGTVESKEAVRDIARRHGLPSAEREDSQDLCFMGRGDYRALLTALHAEAFRPGPIYNEAGEQLGEHRGLPGYTIGQRSGMGIAARERLYVLRKDAARNTLIVGPRAALLRDTCTLEAMTFTAGAPPTREFAARGRVRYRAPRVPVEVTLLPGNRARVSLREPQAGLAPGQSLVLYAGERVLGGGIICADQERAGTVPEDADTALF